MNRPPLRVVAALTTDPVRVARGQAFTPLARLENTDRTTQIGPRPDRPAVQRQQRIVYRYDPARENEAPAVFNLIAERTGSLADTLSLSYHDDEGAPTISEPLTLEVAENHGSPVTIVVVAVLLAAAGIWFWRRRGA